MGDKLKKGLNPAGVLTPDFSPEKLFGQDIKTPKATAAERNLKRLQEERLRSQDSEIARRRGMLGKSGRRSLVSNSGGQKGV